VLSLHTSPLAQPGAGDGGGMNVYVRELCTAMARAGHQCDVFTRADDPGLPAVLPVEPGFRVHHIPAGPLGPVPKSDLGGLVEEFADGVEARLSGHPADLIHAHYWLSGAAGHLLKHRLDLPLVSTFHTLERVKAVTGASDGGDDPRREEVEAAVIGCSDAILAPNVPEADYLVNLYDAPRDRIRVVAPGVDHAFFAPGDRSRARRALGLPSQGTMLLFIGRIQPLKGADVAVGTLAHLQRDDIFLVIAGGPSGRGGEEELARVQRLVADNGLTDRVHFFPPQPHELVSTFCRAADVCLVPSRTESFGLVALEAGACGVPVVATEVGGLRSLIVDGGTGVLVPERRPEGFARAVEWILADPRRAFGLGQAAAQNARRYSWRRAAAAVDSLHHELSLSQLVECA
jgi:D-inositol-3-phosphate glycosyltransferase